MENKFTFSIVMAVYNVEDYINEAIDSVLNQSLNFEENVQLILVDDESSDNSYKICEEYKEKYPKNIILLSKENGGAGSARNLGLKYAIGKYINFLDSDDYFSKNTLKDALNFLLAHDDEVDFVSMPLRWFGASNKTHPLNYKFDGNDRVVNVMDDYEFIQLHSNSSFFKREVIKKYKFLENTVRSEDSFLINQMLLDNPHYGLINKPTYYYRKRHSSSSLTDTVKSKKEYYTDYLKKYCFKLIDYSKKNVDEVPKFIQYLLIYEIKPILYVDDIKSILNKEEYNELVECIKKLLNYVDEDIIKEHKSINNHIKSLLIFLKNDEFNIVVRPKKRKIFLKSNDYIINKLHNHKIRLDIIEYIDNHLNISGLFVGNCYNESISIKVAIKTLEGKEKIYTATRIEYPTTYRNTRNFLGFDWQFYYSFDFKIPIENDENYKITFLIEFNENGEKVTFYPKVKLRTYCNITEFAPFIVKDSKIILFKDDSIHAVNYSFKGRLKFELDLLHKLLTSSQKHKIDAVSVRILYLILKPFWKNKRIWLFMDDIDEAYDNATYLFKYASNNQDNINNYFIIDKNSKDYKKLKKQNENVVSYGSLKHKLLYLYSEKLIHSHVNRKWNNPFNDLNRKLFAGLNIANKYYLQHFNNKDNNDDSLIKFYNNLKLILTESEYEQNKIINGHYNYDEHIVKCLGFPRYDFLNNDNIEKNILFIPSKNSYSVLLRDFSKLDELLNDEDLLIEINKKGYRFVFKPSKDLIPFLDLIKIHNLVTVNIDDSYQDLINKSSLIISNNSESVLDFAYLKKPIIYYINDNESIENNFGDIVKSKKCLLKKVISHMDNGCEMSSQYKKIVDGYFRFDDNENCKRVFSWLKNN
ncbi:glycosyltransferase [uncultured Methanobrevibacter sp.]|uniref:bifunctional glycosyltransferase/CDP-glycerol:glycerophosphate glycerophosphotransferase n=1 Tax=uncultured Methanobrevibacter sp. TaxID=253161 RepID=UPI0025CFA4FE|nr:glycosyltransferase [uncultured Methanobrevibacter sp.]